MVLFLVSLGDFVAFKVFQSFSHNKCHCFLKTCFVKYLHWFLLMLFYSCQKLNHKCWNLSNNFFIMLIKKLKLAPGKSFFMLRAVKDVGYEFGYYKIKPIQSKIAAIHKISSPTTKIDLMRLTGYMSFYSFIIDKLHVNINFCMIHLMIILNFIGLTNWKHCFNKL